MVLLAAKMSRPVPASRVLALGVMLAVVVSHVASGTALAATGTGALDLVTTNADGEKADDGATSVFSSSSDGSRFAFISRATNLVAGVPAGTWQVYVKDVTTGLVQLASSAADATPANGSSVHASISRNGRYVVFDSRASNLSPDGGNSDPQLYVKDLETGDLALASTAADGTAASQSIITSSQPQVSDDGNLVVYSTKERFDPAHEQRTCGGGGGPFYDCTTAEVYVKDLVTGQVSIVTDPGSEVASGSFSLSLTGDGQTLALSTLQQLTAEDTNTHLDIYVIDLSTGDTVLASTPSPSGIPTEGNYSAIFPRLSEDGTRLVFQGAGENWPGSSWPTWQAFHKDLTTGTLELVSTASDGMVANAQSQRPWISADGTHASFSTNATNLDPADADSIADIYLKTIDTGELRLISQTDAGVKSNGSSLSSAPSADGSSVLFDSTATNLDPHGGGRHLYLKVVPQGATDVNGDGVEDALQPDGTPDGSFVDDSLDPPTTGSIIDDGGLQVAITDALDLADGVQISVGEGEGQASFSVCGGFILRLDAGTTAVVTCGSVTLEVTQGRGEIVLGDDVTIIGVPSGATARVGDNNDGTFTVENVGDGDVSVNVAGEISTVSPGGSLDVPDNVAPTVRSVTGPLDPVTIGAQPITIMTGFTDVGDDTHTCTFAWGDTSSSEVTASTSSCTANHSYAAPGVYRVDVTVTDQYGATGHGVFEQLVVVDPAAGFVTGGGWIHSPAGAYSADPELEGKASIGFLSAYEPDATVPDGRTQLRVQAGDLDFRSTAQEWLVIAGARAQVKGSGTLNGEAGYGFMISVVDGQGNSGDTDRFRIKIWQRDSEEDVVYDSMMGESVTATPSTVLGGGSIVIHTRR